MKMKKLNIQTMKIRKTYLAAFVVALALAFPQWASAQQDPLFTQYMYNVLSINPGYAGSRDALSVVGIHRSQWMGFEGAPSTQNLTIHSPLRNKNFALGGSLIHDQIGPTQQFGAYADFAGRVWLTEKSRLSLGIKAGFNYLQTDIVGLGINNPDPAYNENINRLNPNVGFGLYYHSPNFFAGYSIPKFFENDLSDTPAGSDSEAREERHQFIIVGGVIPMGSQVKFQPSAFLRMVNGAPASVDVTANFLFIEKIWVGGFWRYDSNVGMLAAYQLSPQFKLGVAYDYTLNELMDYTSGSFEIMLTYDFIFEKGAMKSPRYF
jgi:type IX secretion system PorP/SprF family membrane protein